MLATLDGPKMARNDLTVKIDADIVTKAKHVSFNRRITLAAYLSEMMRPLVDRDFEEEMAKMSKLLPSASKPKGKGSKGGN
jgi:hypothetical protein